MPSDLNLAKVSKGVRWPYYLHSARYMAERILLDNILFPALMIKEGRDILKVSVRVVEWESASCPF
jgi:hypothetical protein